MDFIRIALMFKITVKRQIFDVSTLLAIVSPFVCTPKTKNDGHSCQLYIEVVCKVLFFNKLNVRSLVGSVLAC